MVDVTRKKRFIAQLASIATYGNSNLVLEKKKEGIVIMPSSFMTQTKL